MARVGKKKKGLVFVTAILALATMFMTGVTFMGMAANQFGAARRDLHALHALSAADAGLNYMIYLKQQDPSTTGVRAGENLDLRRLSEEDGLNPDLVGTLANTTDTYAVWLLAVSGNSDAFQIISRGTHRGYTRTVRAVVRAPRENTEDEDPGGGEEDPVDPPEDDDDPPVIPPPWDPIEFPMLDYAIFTHGSLSLTGYSLIEGHAGSNNALDMGGQARVTGNAFSGTGQIRTRGQAQIGGSRIRGTESMPFPEIELNNYRALAQALDDYAREHSANPATYTNRYYLQGGLTINSDFTFPSDGAVVFVEGDVTFSSHPVISGRGTIVCTGNMGIHAHAHVESDELSSEEIGLSLICGGNCTINAQVVIEATVFALGGITFNGQADLYGAIYGYVGNNNAAGGGTIHYRTPTAPGPPDPPPPDDDDDDDGGDDDDDDDGGGDSDPPGSDSDDNAWTVCSWELL